MSETKTKYKTQRTPAPVSGPIYNQEAEEALIGSILISEDSLLDIADLDISPNHFWIEYLGWIFESAQELHRARVRVDFVTLGDKLALLGQLDEIGGQAELIRLSNVTPTHTHAHYYADIVKRDWLKRQALDFAGAVAKLAHGEMESAEMLEEMQAGLMDLLKSLGSDSGATLAEIASTAHDLFEKRTQMSGIVGLPTGLADVDKILGGLKRGKMYTLAGRPGMGKSSLATQIAWTAARDNGARVMLFSLEMDRIEIFNRLWAYESGIPGQAIDNGTIPEEKWDNLFEAQNVLAKNDRLKIVDDSTLTPGKIRQQALAHWARYGLDLIIIDYLQLMVSGRRSENRQAEVSAISRAIKVLAGELNIPIIALSQLNRGVESRPDKRPMLADLRDSGAIEQDSDAVIFLYRDSVYNLDTEFPNLVEAIIAKHRSGPRGIATAFFRDEIFKFADLETTTTRLSL